MDLIDRVSATIKRYRMFEKGETVVVAVSGGPDSVALLHLLWRLQTDWNLRLHVAHLDHGLRGQESKKDSESVSLFAQRLNLPLTVDVTDVAQMVRAGGGSIEGRAREVRYAFLREVAEVVGAAKIATGHNADDRAETVMMWLLRGAGPTGLRGLPPVREGFVVRPLIEVTRDQIEEYLKEQGLSPRRDASNLDSRHLRNRIRNELLPLLKKEYNPHLILHLGQLADLMEQEEDFFGEEVKRALPALVKRAGRRKIILDVQALLMYHLGLRRRIIRHAIRILKGDLQGVLYSHVQMLLDGLDSEGAGRIVHLPGQLVAERTGEALIFRKGSIVSYDHPVVVPGRTELPEIEGALVTERIRADGVRAELKRVGKETGYFDNSAVNGRLRVRTRRRGDAFQPLGMKGTKKLQDFFVDEKIPRLDRQEIPLLTVGDDIAWVVGWRMAEKFKVTQGTREVLKVDFVRPD